MLSDDDKEVDVESDGDDGNDSDTKQSTSRMPAGNQYYTQADKRAHHNALERKRRDHIKDSFSSLRDSVPTLNGEKVASRAQILKKAAEYIMLMRKKNNCHQQDIHDLRKQNSLLEAQIRTLERAKKTGIFDKEVNKCMFESDTESSEEEEIVLTPKKKPRRLKTRR